MREAIDIAEKGPRTSLRGAKRRGNLRTAHEIVCEKRNNKIGTKMKKQMKRTVYEAPVTERFQVELEGAILGASIIDENHNPGDIESGDQGVNNQGGWGDFNDGFSDSGWGTTNN